VISLREFTNNALNQHHGIQTTERFGVDTDPDGDGVKNEMTRADVTALTVYQAVMAAPGRVIPNDPVIESAVWNGEKLFEQIGCASCHVPRLPLDQRSWILKSQIPTIRRPICGVATLRCCGLTSRTTGFRSLDYARTLPVRTLSGCRPTRISSLHDITDGRR